MSRIKRAQRIRDLVLAEANMTFESSLALSRTKIISTASWRARLCRERLGYVSTPDIEAVKLELWVEGEKVAIMAWTSDDFWRVRMDRGPWEATHFNQAPYRTSAQRWLDICSREPIDFPVLSLARVAKHQSEADLTASVSR